MDVAFPFLNSLTVGNWISILFGTIAAIGVCFTAANYLAGRQERLRKVSEAFPEVRGIINRTEYPGGWRSVQLHLKPRSDSERNFDYGNWRIERACLIRPASARLARAQGDDYAIGIFDPKNLVRILDGRDENSTQRFALEFFIKFMGNDERRGATFKVVFSHATKNKRRTDKVTATMPGS